mmetsp:Transcript_9270/g.14261  ORF Transcript_9270/g.14261 Transcript_9270/m.14261 type:complete len:111 (-) Transcript_9270:58-390(-)
MEHPLRKREGIADRDGKLEKVGVRVGVRVGNATGGKDIGGKEIGGKEIGESLFVRSGEGKGLELGAGKVVELGAIDGSFVSIMGGASSTLVKPLEMYSKSFSSNISWNSR